ncbi:MAG: hypothetical protein RLZZ142_2103, partial [Verrucomicrobiota bacterium]
AATVGSSLGNCMGREGRGVGGEGCGAGLLGYRKGEAEGETSGVGEVLFGDALEVGAGDGEVAVEFGVDEGGVAVKDVVMGEGAGAVVHGAARFGELGFHVIAGFLELFFGDALFDDLGDFGFEELVELLEGDPGLAGNGEGEDAGFLEEVTVGHGAHGDAFLFDEALVEAGGAAVSEDVGEHLEGVGVGMGF